MVFPEYIVVDLPLSEGADKWSGGKLVSVFDSTIVTGETLSASRQLGLGVTPKMDVLGQPLVEVV